MKCEVKCECGKLSGTAELTIPPLRKNIKPELAYTLTGAFRVEKERGFLHPVCNECQKPPMTVRWVTS